MKSQVILALTLVTACSSAPQHSPSEPTGLETVVIMGINDLHGTLAPLTLQTREAEGIEPILYERGGASILAAHANILRSEYPNHFLILDAGDEFQGTIESNLEKGAPVIQFFNALGVHAAAIGNHEFDFGPLSPENLDPLGTLKARMSEAQYPYLAANIIDRNTRQLPALPNIHPHTLLAAGNLKIGVIGLSTLETPRTTRAAYVRSLEFTSLKEATLQEARALRKAGAHLIIIVAHVGLKCDLDRQGYSPKIRTPHDPTGECDPNDEMVVLLNSLPPHTVDAVIAGHSHQIVHHWINEVPVIESGSHSQYYHLLYLTYDGSRKKLLSEKTQIEGPIPICPKVFQHQNDCHGERPAPRSGRGPLVTPLLHGKNILADAGIQRLLAPALENTEAAKKQILAQAAYPIDHVRTRESALGNLIADAMRSKVGADVAIMNSGGIRSSLEAGPISYEAIFRVLPFENSISKLVVTGKELRDILQISENGARGFFAISGMQLRLVNLDSAPLSRDLNHNGRIEPWEVNRLLDIRLKNGSRIQNQRNYTLATVDFLVTGGDDMGWIMSKIPPERIQLNAGGLLRDAVIEYMKIHSPLNSEEMPLLDPAHPRLKFQKLKKKQKAQSRTNPMGQ